MRGQGGALPSFTPSACCQSPLWQWHCVKLPLGHGVPLEESSSNLQESSFKETLVPEGPRLQEPFGVCRHQSRYYLRQRWRKSRRGGTSLHGEAQELGECSVYFPMFSLLLTK